MRHAAAVGMKEKAPGHGTPKLVAFVNDAATTEVLQQVVLERRLDGAVIHEGGLGAALNEVTSMNLPELLVVDVGDSQTAVSDVSSLATACGGASKLIVIGDVNDVQLYRDLLGAGAADYLVKPVNRYQLLSAVLDSNQPNRPAKSEKRMGQLMVCLGARGGAGSTTTAVSLAWLLANQRSQKVALVDLDLQFGTVALALNVTPGRGLREALEQPGRIDSLFIERAAEKIGDNLYVLGAEEPLEDELGIDLTAPSLLLHELRERFDWVVVDLPRGVSMMHRQVLADATAAMVMVELTLSGIRDGIRLNALIQDCAPQVHAVFGATARNLGRGQKIGPKDFEKSVGRPIAAILPWDPATTVAAAGAGRPIPAVAKGSKLAVGFEQLLEAVAGREVAKPKSLWKKMLRKE